MERSREGELLPGISRPLINIGNSGEMVGAPAMATRSSTVLKTKGKVLSTPKSAANSKKTGEKRKGNKGKKKKPKPKKKKGKARIKFQPRGIWYKKRDGQTKVVSYQKLVRKLGSKKVLRILKN